MLLRQLFGTTGSIREKLLSYDALIILFDSLYESMQDAETRQRMKLPWRTYSILRQVTFMDWFYWDRNLEISAAFQRV